MSKAQLKKTLGRMEASEISEMVMELYEARPEAKEYLEYWLNPNSEAELEKYKVKAHRLFFTTSGKPRKRPTITSLRQLVKYFSSICFDSEMLSELYVYICSIDIEWLRTRRNPLTNIKTVKSNLETARLFVESAGMEDRFGLKLDRLDEEMAVIEEVGKHRGRLFGWRRRRW